MAEQNRESSMEEILSSIKRIIAEDKVIEVDRPVRRKKQPVLKAVSEQPAAEDPVDDDEVLELTVELAEELTEELPDEAASSAQGVFGDRRKLGRLIDDQKLDSMRQSLSALVEMDNGNNPAPAKQSGATSLEDMTREMMRPMLKQWLDDNLPELVEELVAREIQRISQK